MDEIDLFGNPIIKDVLLRDKFIEPPFSVLDSKSGHWQDRKRKWKNLGIESEEGRGENLLKYSPTLLSGGKKEAFGRKNGLCFNIRFNEYNEEFDFLFSCPPYWNLEVYSNLPEDLSNMDYANFKLKYFSIIKKSFQKLKKNHYACFVVSEIRDKDGFYIDFVGDTKKAFIEAGGKFYNDAVLLNCIGTACMRANGTFGASEKLIRVHQNILVFKK